MEGVERGTGEGRGDAGAAAAEEPVVQADRLFVNLTEQAVPPRSRARPGPSPEPDRGPDGAGRETPAAPPRGPVERADLDEVLEIVRVALSAINGRLDALERVLLTEISRPASTEVGEPRGGPEVASAASDDALTTTEDVKRASGGLPVLGLIPEVEGWTNRTIPLLRARTAEERVAGEAYRALRTSVLYLGIDKHVRSLQVTSPLQGEGKSVTAANLAVTLAEAGNRVIALSSDLRRPRLHELFGLSNAQGYTSVLQKRVSLQSVVQQVPAIPGLKVVASGPVPANPSELLLSERAAAVIRVLQDQCDVLLIDCPPVLPVTDAVAISKSVQGTIIVVNPSLTAHRDVRRAVEILRQVNAPLLGTVVNGIAEDHRGFNLGRELRYQYTSDPAPDAGAADAGAQRPPAGGPPPGEASPPDDQARGERGPTGASGRPLPVKTPEKLRRIWESRNPR